MERSPVSGTSIETTDVARPDEPQRAAGVEQPVAIQRPDPYVGKVIGDRYEVLEVVGKGGMGVVYRVRHKQLHKSLALKMLPSKDGLDREAVARFDAEAKAASGLHHPHLAGIHDYGTTDDGSPYLVMDFVEGTSLMQRIAKDGALPQEEALKIFIQLCDGLDYAHRKRIVHRDVKPSNIMISGTADKPVACIVDFGIAKEVQTDEQTTGLTQTGTLLGSPKYMSPEQCGGQKVDSRTDIYSLGCAMFEALTGQPLFTGDGPMQVMYKHLNERPPLFKTVAKDRNISSALERVVMQMLEKEPDNRYQSAADVKRDLDLILQGKNPVKEVSRLRRKVQSLLKAAKVMGQIALIAGITAGVCFAAWYSLQNSSAWEWERREADGQMRIGPDNYAEALVHYKKALALAKRGGANAGEIENILMETGRLQGYLKWHEQAITSLKEALASSSNHNEDGLRGTILDVLAQQYLDLKQYAEAEGIARRAIDVKRRQYGEVNWFTGHSVSRLTQALYKQQRYGEAEGPAQEYVDIETKLFPQEDNSEVLDAYEQLTKVLAHERKVDPAVQNAEKTFSLYLKMQGADSPRTEQFARWYIEYLKRLHRDGRAADIAKQVPGAQ